VKLATQSGHINVVNRLLQLHPYLHMYQLYWCIIAVMMVNNDGNGNSQRRMQEQYRIWLRQEQRRRDKAIALKIGTSKLEKDEAELEATWLASLNDDKSASNDHAIHQRRDHLLPDFLASFETQWEHKEWDDEAKIQQDAVDMIWPLPPSLSITTNQLRIFDDSKNNKLSASDRSGSSSEVKTSSPLLFPSLTTSSQQQKSRQQLECIRAIVKHAGGWKSLCDGACTTIDELFGCIRVLTSLYF
jgi:hypothetical protein